MKRADADPDYICRGNTFLKVESLCSRRKPSAVLRGQLRGLDIHAAGLQNEALNVGFHVQFFDQRSTQNGNNQPKDYVEHGSACTEDAGDSTQGTEIDHWRGDEERECHPQKVNPAESEADEKRNRGTGAKTG